MITGKTMKKFLAKYIMTFVLLSFSLCTMAEDIDLFSGVPTSTTDMPNVLIILDNTANWSSAFSNEMSSLASVVSGLPANQFRLGIMMFTENGSGNSGNSGAYVRAAIRPLSTNNKSVYQNLVNSLSVNADKSSGGKAGKAMEEAYLYFSGGTPYAGNNKVKTDYTSNSSGTTQSNAVYSLPNQALSSFSATPYISPVVASCAKNFIIYISNGAVQDNTSDTTQATAALSSAGGDTTAIAISPSGSQSNVSDEWARFMKKSGLAVTTYTVDINKVTTGQGPGWTALLKSMAGESSGKYFDVSSTGTQIADALSNIFSEIQSVNSVFAAVSLPVSINTQGTYLNQLYIGMFRPDQNSSPRWNGNLKQYKLGYFNNVLQLLDADDAPAVNSTSGFIAPCARSFWTPTTLDSYWAFKPQGTCLTANSDISNGPDGSIVEKGAQAYVLRGSAIRNIKTCSPSSCLSLTNFNNLTVSQSMLGAASIAERDALINWESGLDIDDENLNANTSEKRPSVHGDVVHSRPVAINYGTDANPQVVVFYGGNDGILRGINGNRISSIGTTVAGGELWAFVAPEFYSKIKRIRDNLIPITVPGFTTGTPTPQPKDYGVDGAITAYKDSTSTSVFAVMRRGGRALYAFDVTDPSSPLLKWKIGCPNTSNDIGCSSGLTGLGQTWSSAKVIKTGGYGLGSSPILIMGGGYDTCQDSDPNSGCGSGSKGSSIYVLDASNGSLLKTFSTDSSVVADLTIIPDTTTGLIKYAYTADLGGNIYRISGATANTPIGVTVPALWTITKIASLGGTGTDNRKFMFAPDVLDDNGTYDLLIGSGDREKPIASYTASASVQNEFYLVKDNPSNLNWLSSEFSNCGSNIICTRSLFSITGTTAPTTTQLASKKGWYLALGSSEQVVTSAITVFGTVTFSTHIPTLPAIGTCTTLGTANVYNINYTNAAPSVGSVRASVIVGGGLPPSPVAGMVTLDNGSTVPFIVGASSSSSLQGSNPIPSGTTKRGKGRVYWNVKK